MRVSKKSDVAILSCVATGNPSPILVWAKNGGEFFYPGAQEGDRIFIEGDGSLVIESPTKEDSGLYTCFVANGVGSAAARSNLVVRGNKIDLDDDARAAIKSQKVDSVRITSAKAAGPTSIKVIQIFPLFLVQTMDQKEVVTGSLLYLRWPYLFLMIIYLGQGHLELCRGVRRGVQDLVPVPR